MIQKVKETFVVLTSNHLWDTFNQVQNLCVLLLFCVNICMFKYKGFQFQFFIILHCLNFKHVQFSIKKTPKEIIWTGKLSVTFLFSLSFCVYFLKSNLTSIIRIKNKNFKEYGSTAYPLKL